MNYEEALKHSLTVPWKVGTCQQGEKCWCRTIIPEEEILDDEGEDIYIASGAEIHKVHAEHIVKLHNESLTNKVTRLEVINHQDEPIGRVYSKHNCKNVETSLQDEGRTLKIFINEG